ncbi:glutathione peroxidase [Alteromonas antoniana]|uniref:glutathione peroxidase n=1 Tax=Alteromonas antoniana TaxID=2803813 RepID=UPI001C486813|nr:glutathione peroxidase [Alteromonas antoniana]
MSTTIYSHTAVRNNGETESLDAYKGKVLLIVNTASKCGFTYQYEGLETLYKQYKDRGFAVLAFPCDQFGHQEPGDDEQIAGFCSGSFGVTFPLFKKTDVNGDSAHPLYVTLKSEAPGILGTKKIKWNFTKFLVDTQGHVVKRYGPTTKPEAIASDIESCLK